MTHGDNCRKAAQVAEAIKKLEEVRKFIDACVCDSDIECKRCEATEALMESIALLKEGTK